MACETLLYSKSCDVYLKLCNVYSKSCDVYFKVKGFEEHKIKCGLLFKKMNNTKK